MAHHHRRPAATVDETHGTQPDMMMPRRRRTRAADMANRIKAERALNDAYIAERNKPPPI